MSANSSIIHKYTVEGRYNVTLYGRTESGLSEHSDWVVVDITNNAPQFDISIPASAYEDEVVNISVIDIVESEHDLEPGILTYEYDFSDGNKTTSNSSCITHKWTNTGIHNIIVTVIDDQNAVIQRSKIIEIENRAPEANFSFSIDSASNDTIKSYYGTYDFRGDIIGEGPKDWDIYDSHDVGLETVILRPNGDNQTEWYPLDSVHSSLINETCEPDGSTIYPMSFSVNILADIFDMQTYNLQGGSVVKITIYTYGMTQDIQSHPKSNIQLGGWKDEKSWSFQLDEYSWQNITWDGLNGSQADLDNLQIQFSAQWRLFLKPIHIDKVYCEITYTHGENLKVKVVNEGGYYREVVRFKDNDYQEQLWIENNFFSQNGGTIEYYIKSNDTSSQTWALCLYDGSSIGLKLFMETQWKYINGTSHVISEYGNPTNNQWYHVRLDFCTSGSYLNLSAHRFRLTIDNISSNIYYFKDINQVNKIRFESGSEDKGITFIDAIGYSWDPEYNLGDNKYAVISYPEKTNVRFTANCSDSESDIPSLRYYWNFDDGISDFGKNISHTFLSGGKYYINLTVKDDNGATDWISKLVLVHNSYPEVVDINCSDDTAFINEGETIIFNVVATDDESDLSRLGYFWDFECYDFNPYDFSGESGGWVNSYLYDDDLSCNSYILVKDPDGAYGYRAIQVTVQNVNPLLSIFDASVISNISFEVYRNSLSNNANFTFSLISNEEPYLTRLLNFTGSQDNLVFSYKENIAMTLSKIWKVNINSSEILPENSWFRCYVKLEFLDGSILIISSGKLYGGEFGHWEVDLNPYFYNNGDYTFMYPVTFSSHIFDPSIDDIFFSLNYNVSMQLEINCSDSLPISDSFELNNVNYTINIFEVDGTIFVNITAFQQVLSDSYLENCFPVALDVSFTLNPVIDLYELLEVQMELSNLEILSCNTAYNTLSAFIIDDDGGQNTLTIKFNTTDNIVFENLSPRIDSYFPENGLVGKNISFYIDISDFDQITEQEDYYVSNFKSEYVPLYPDDFSMINGTIEESGNLIFQDGDVMEILPDADGQYPATYSFENDADGSNPDGWIVDESLGIVQVIDELDGHKKVVEIHETAQSLMGIINTFDTPQTSGVIEFWVMTNRNDDYGQLTIYDDTGGNHYDNAVHLSLFSDGTIRYYDGDWNNIILSYSANTWYHFKVEFDCSGDWRLWINDVEYGPYPFNGSPLQMEKLLFESSDAGTYKDWYMYIDAVGYSWDATYNIGDNLESYSELDFTTTFRINSIDNDIIIKYLKLYYSFKTESSQQVNFSIYNFHSESWELIDSPVVNISYYTNKYSILNSEFINKTTILVRVYCKNSKFFIDQFRIEYYSAKISDKNLFEHDDIPISSDFTVLSGSCNLGGDLQDQNNIYHTFSSSNDLGESSHYTGTFSFENDADGSNPDGWIVDESLGTVQVIDELDGHKKVVEIHETAQSWMGIINTFDTPQTSGVIEFWVMTNRNDDYGQLTIYDDTGGNHYDNAVHLSLFSDGTIRYYDGDWNNIIQSYSANTWYHFKVEFDCSGDWHLWINGVEYGPYPFNGAPLQMEKLLFESSDAGTYKDWYMYIDAVGYSWDATYNIGDNLNPITGCLSFISEFKLEGVRLNDQLQSVEMFYSFKTNISQSINTSLYDFISHKWMLINTSINTVFSNLSYSLTGTNYISRYYRILVKFEGINSSRYKFYLDMLKIKYSWIKGSYQEDALYNDVPDLNSDIIVNNGLLNSIGDLSKQNFDYTIFDSNSNSTYEIDLVSEFNLEDVLLGDIIDYLCLNYSLKTDISQLINISLYNFTSNEWFLIESSKYLSFTNLSYVIPITRTEIINGNETIEHHDFFDSNYKILVKIQATNQSSDFQLFLDKLVIEYKFSPYSFRSDTYGFLDVVEGDYIEIESSQDSVTDYIGSYSFENEEDNTQGTDIVFIDECDINAKFMIISDYSNHNKVLRVPSYYHARHNFESGVIQGTIEYYWLTTDSNKKMIQSVYQETGESILSLSCDNGYFQYYVDPGYWINIMPIENNRWYHIRFDFDFATSKYSIFIDGVQRLINQAFVNLGNELAYFYLELDDFSPCYNYFDAFGFSWHSNYTVGENIPTHYLNETFDLDLDEMSIHQLELFDMCNINYSIKTTITQNISIRLYNYISGNWTEFQSLTTDNSKYYNGTILLDDTNFISPDCKVTIQFLGFNSTTYDLFKLLINRLEAKYNWTNILIDFGTGSNSQPLQIDYTMSSRYSNILSTDSIFDYEGTYLVMGAVDDGILTSKTGYLIEVNNLDPFAKIDDFSNEVFEDKKLSFTADINAFGTDFTMSNFRYFWLFGDGHFSNEMNPTHSYAQSGVYNVSFTIKDCFGNSYTDIRNITVLERKPEILGPFTFNGIEGQAVILDVDIFDAFLDEIDMKYEWYDESLNLIANQKNPSIILDDGTYLYTLNVTDSLGLTASVNISIVIEDVPPVVLVSNYVSYFGKASENEGFITGGGNGPGEMELKAFAYDSLDNDDLDYYWTITNGNKSYIWYDLDSGLSSSVKFRATETVLYRGQVRVVSTEKSTTSVFCINSIIDSNGNGFDDEFEARLLATNENITAFSDTDDDCYTDLYELAISNTSYLDPDSDGDGLYDALDPLTGIGEQSARTDPLDWDCDDDILSDRIEVFGWTITTELFEEILVNSDPWDNDTDNDGLSDYDEYFKGSNPRNTDSDNDGLSDLIDPFPMKFDNDKDGLSDGIEYQIGTNMNNSDTDQDGISDGEEYFGWAFKTNPLSADSDHDFLADTAEMQNYHVAIEDRFDLDDPISLQFETNCEKAVAAQVAFTISFGEAINEPENDAVYGIQNIPDLKVSIYKKDDNLLLYQNNSQGERYFSQVVDIRELIENLGLDYRGEYRITIDQAGTGAILEQFEVDITGYLNPNKKDFDRDGIMDGVETGLLVRGYGTIDFKDSYMYDNLTVDDNPNTYDEFYLTIPYIGRVYDADLYLKVISEGIPEGTGNITIKIIKEEMNCNIDDAILVNYFSNFNNISAFTYETSVDLKNCLNNEDITEYYGTYLLKIIIHENGIALSNFTLSEFYIQTDTFIEAQNTDTKAYYTNPAKKDTDGDGWNDHFEIYTKETNPLSTDTDGDNVWDPYDRDPHRDVMLKVSPVSATHPKRYKIKIVVKFTGDDGQDYCFITPKKKADVDEGSLWTAYYDGTHGSPLNLHYYVDINDDTRILASNNGNMRFDMEFWQVDRYFLGIRIWDRKVIEGSKNYEVGSTGNYDTLIIDKYEGSNLICQAKVKVETIGIEKANTIAVYRINEIFNGHYQEQHKMNIIQLHITNTPSSSSPFIKGVNNIVVPTDLFTETVLNGYIQNERLDETFFYSDDEDIFKFIAVDREGFSEQATEEIDFIMIRFDITAANAEDLLDLILTCVINDTTQEEAVLYTWCSTKINGISATMMNLPLSVLEFIPWVCDFENSEQGGRPKDSDDWFWAPAKALGGIIAGLIITTLMLAVLIVALIVAFVYEVILMTLLPILAYVLWIIVRTVLLILFYILLAIELVFICLEIISIGVPLLAISQFIAISSAMGLNLLISYGKNKCAGFYEIISSDTTIRVESWIEWSYWSFFDLYFPLIVSKTIYDGTTIQESKEGVINEESSEKYSEPMPTATSVCKNPILFDHEYYNTTSSNNIFRFKINYLDSNFEEPDLQYGVKLHLVAPNGTVLDNFQMVTEDENPDYSNSEGVVYNYTINTSSFEDGLWHYYFTAKDYLTENITLYPENKYLVGPDTSNGPGYLMGSRVSNLNSSYYNPEGWVNDVFYFFVDWWDVSNGLAPSNVSLCLIPANITDSTGISNRWGIQKFTMQPVLESPDYSSSVEYYTTVNFNALGYKDTEIGIFHHYYEAIDSNGKIINALDFDGNGSSYFYGPFVRSINIPTVEIISYSTSNSDLIISSDTIIRYILEISNYNGDTFSETPKISIENGNTIIEYNMTRYYVSGDTTLEKYYIDIYAKDLEAGRTGISFILPDKIKVVSKDTYLKEFFVLNFFSDAISTISSTIGMLGISAFSMFSVMSGLTAGKQILPVAIIGIGILAMSSIFMVSCLMSNDYGKLLGYALGCLILWIMMKTCVVIEDNELKMTSNSLKFLKSVGGYWKFQFVLAYVVQSMALIFTLLFPENYILAEILWFVSNIFAIFPLLLGAYSAIWALNFAIVFTAHFGGGKLSFSQKIFTLSYSIYKKMIFIGALLGFLLFGIKIGFGIGTLFS